MISDIKKVIKIIKDGGVVVIPTDTIYGVVGSALKKDTVEKIYLLRKREKNKPMITLISSLDDLSLFNIKLSKKQTNFLNTNWPNPLSVIFESLNKEFEYLHRGTSSLAFRFPKLKWLQQLLKETGPLIAPSANLSGMKVAENIRDAKKYFKDTVDFYIDGGVIISKPSTLVKFDNGKLVVLREGIYKVDE